MATATAVALLAILAAFGVDISATRYVRLDAAVRDAFPEDELPEIRFGDPSSFLLWAPAEQFLWDSLRSGRLPLWDRRQGGGYSPIIAFYLGALHPLRWLCVLAPRGMMPNALIVVSLCLAALGAYQFARSLQLESPAAVVAALLYSLSPAMISVVHYSGALLPLAHLPWILLVYRKYLATRHRRWFFAQALLLALLFISGHPSIILGACLAVLFVAIADGIRGRSLRPVLILGVAALLATLMAAFALLPPLLALPELWTYKTATAEGIAFRPLTLAQWLDALLMMARDRMRYVFPDQPVSYAYVGVPVLIFIVLAAWARRGRSTEITTALVMSGIWFLLMIPGPWMLPFQHVPPIRFMTPWYFSGFFGFWVAIAAASGFALLWQRSGAARLAAIGLALFAGVLYTPRAYKVLDPEPWRAVVGGQVMGTLGAAREHVRVTGTFGQVHAANVSAFTKIEDVRFLAPLFPLRYERWWSIVDADAIKRAYAPVRITDHLQSPLIGDFNIAYVLQSRFPATDVFWTVPDPAKRDRFLSPRLVSPSFPVVFQTPSLLVHLNRASPVHPRVHFQPRAVYAGDLAAAVRMLKADATLPLRAAVVEHDHPLSLPPVAEGTARVRYPGDAEAIVDVESSTGGLLVLHDAYARGWRATIDGNETEIMPVNVLSRGVVVPRGNHRIVFRYMPPGFVAGAVISLLTIAGCALAARGLRKVKWATACTAAHQ